MNLYHSKRRFLQATATGILALGTIALGCVILPLPSASAQTQISGDIVGSITDPSGAAVPNAKVTVTSKDTGETRSAVTDAAGNYRVPLLRPGSYSIAVSAQGFSSTTTVVSVGTGQVTQGSLRLALGSSAQTIEVSSAAPLLHTDAPDVSTTFDMQQVQNVPNPGNDLTYVAQTAPGSVMNTQSGYGNFSSFGLPATSNTFTVNGGYQNDPFLNLNNSGASNLLLGNNDIDQVTVVSNAYDAAFGGLGGAQVNEISRAGSNSFHGNATYWWNGRIMNANDWFNNHAPAGQQTPRPFDNANQWAAAIGGPVKRDKLFFFINTEGLRVIIPVRATIYAPSPQFQCQTLGTCPVPTDPADPNYLPDLQSTDPTRPGPSNLITNGNASEIPLYQRIFSFYNNAKGANAAAPDPNDPSAVIFNGIGSNLATEWLLSSRVDYNLSNNDKLFVHFHMDKGVQPTQTNLLSPLFSALSPQPEYDGQLNETHTFSPNVTNQFLFTANYYRAIFTNTQSAQANAQVPFVLYFVAGGDLSASELGTSNVGGANYAFPQGRNVTGYQFTDDLSMSRGNHTIKVGFTMRRNDITDYYPNEYTTPLAEVYSQADFAEGFTDRWLQRFPTRLTQPIALYAMGGYVQDQWKFRPNFTLTAGLRLEHNANPTCLTNCFSNFPTDFTGLSADTATPYNQLIASGRRQAFLSQQIIAYEPRIGFAYQPTSRSTLRGGFGMFADSFPAQIADNLLGAPPDVNRFTINGAYFGNPYTLDPSRPDSAQATAVTSNAAFAAAFQSGGSYSSISTTVPGFRAPALTGTAPKVYLPTYEEYSLTYERQITSATAVSIGYVGNHGYHEPVLNSSLNAYISPAAGSVIGIPSAIPNPSFGTAGEYYSGASSNYNGAIASLVDRHKWLTLQLNYVYSHALDEASNGGFNAFGANPIGQEDPHNLAQNYGNADYDVRHYVSASYVIPVPTFYGPKFLTSNWQFAGTVFHSSGYPFTVLDSATTPTNGGSTLFADQLTRNIPHTCGGESAASGIPCAFGAPGGSGAGFAYFDYANSTFGQRRNTFFGPAYTNSDFTVTKGFPVPHLENGRLNAGAQFFNVFNHPNFAQPLTDVAYGPGTTGTINAMAQTPTSILGAFLGGDSGPRAIQLKISLNF